MSIAWARLSAGAGPSPPPSSLERIEEDGRDLLGLSLHFPEGGAGQFSFQKTLGAVGREVLLKSLFTITTTFCSLHLPLLVLFTSGKWLKEEVSA